MHAFQRAPGVLPRLVRRTGTTHTCAIKTAFSTRCLMNIARIWPTGRVRYMTLFGNVTRLALRPAYASNVQRRRYASDSYPPHLVVAMPALSPTMTKGNVGAWQKKIGDEIAPGDVLVEIETDKAQMDFECQDEGYLAKILVESGTKDVSVGTPIAITTEEKHDVDKFADFTIEGASKPSPESEEGSESEKLTPEKSKSEKSKLDQPTEPTRSPPPSQSSEKRPSGRIFASPLARKMADERSISLDQVKGTGPGGRIIAADIKEFVDAPQPPKEVPRAPTAPTTAAYTDIPLSNIRKVIAERLTESKTTRPHYYLTIEVEMDKVLKLREALNKDADGKYKLSVNDFVVKSAAHALLDVPEVNSSWQDDFIRQYHTADISVATATPSGLITPIVTNVESKGLATISNQIKDMASRAREGKLAPHEFQGGSFSVSNLGMYGIKSFTAIINPPQSCILAVGAAEKKLVPDTNSTTGYRVINTMHVTLSCDHRVVDGAVGAQWLSVWSRYIENPLRLLL